jgi:hypothetical protein
MNRTLGILIASCAAVLICSPARASTSFSISPSTFDALPGDVGDAFDVVFTNLGPGSITVAGFAFEVSVTDTDITLTGADFSTSAYPYIFAGDSVDEDLSVPLNLPTSGQTLDANDTYDLSGGITLTSDESLALGEVLFSVSPTAATGPFTVSFTGIPAPSDANNLSDPSGNAINVDSFIDGTIDITGSTESVPEPSSFFLVLAGIAAVLPKCLLSRR